MTWSIITLLVSEVDRDAGVDSDVWLLPLVTADYVDRPPVSSKAVQARILKTIADEETELLDEELLDLIAAGRAASSRGATVC